LRGARLVRASTLPGDLKEKLIEVYHELCDDVHPSVAIIRRDMRKENFNFEYDETSFDKSLDLHLRVLDMVLTVVLNRFPKAIENFVGDYDILPILEDLGLEETMRICE
jgi:hypothetical protein